MICSTLLQSVHVNGQRPTGGQRTRRTRAQKEERGAREGSDWDWADWTAGSIEGSTVRTVSRSCPPSTVKREERTLRLYERRRRREEGTEDDERRWRRDEREGKEREKKGTRERERERERRGGGGGDAAEKKKKKRGKAKHGLFWPRSVREPASQIRIHCCRSRHIPEIVQQFFLGVGFAGRGWAVGRTREREREGGREGRERERE
ncbi:hypothetical protein MARPO_0014s0156 [Marchantia polymorpha]|uniref:Uncharacterized protein n=1 Tax=Marchantia polymorpha TaxID=3197 RepID=A0A2R6XHR6_MARPO|nr:hypothetical protein MARPO_0014s0156 [Marchantia polymorpha]|eukprot:PTQ45642.1 hypothetical protein MARPO_0014s0156 [Marchantia polymorpha]